ncbi:hypothetical protein [Acuticoccus kandeliae]|uniref:hypothetical protein n=1 Tax=Acuticoccus kandeliae TaxID=2073160 RepID=UPI000D3E5842|nr:hypothetical protein [Acuticoccus kandeliae]
MHRLAYTPGVERLSIGSKKLALDPVWAEPPIADIEVALLRNAAFPELAREGRLAHEFVVVDPGVAPSNPSHEDLAIRLNACAARLKIPLVVIGNETSVAFGNGGFPTSTHDLPAAGTRRFSEMLGALRERLALVLASSRYSRKRHIFVPVFDAALLATMVDLLSEIAPASRPFVHLATWWDGTTMPRIADFAPLQRIGARIDELNGSRPTIFLYAWSRQLAQRLTAQMGVPVQAIDSPPELSLESPGEAPPDRFTVGYLSAATRACGFDQLARIIRSANQAATNPQRTRFIIHVRPDPNGASLSDEVQELKAELAAIPERNVSIIDEFMPRPIYLAAMKRIDALLLPYPPNGGAERHSSTALHAMAAGKPILTYNGVQIVGTLRSRIMRAADDRVLGEIVSDMAADAAHARRDAAVAKSTYWATLRPSRLFAQLLYGPLIIANATGHEQI